MPNYCTNQVTLTGDIETLIALDLIMKSPGWENDDRPGNIGQPMRLMPMPKVLHGTRSPAPSGDFDADGHIMKFVNAPEGRSWTPERYENEKAEHSALVERANKAMAETGHSDWHSWAVAHWGTKWSMEVTGYDFDAKRGVINISGLTAWGPPIALWENVGQKFEVTISGNYIEEGMDFIGAFVIVDGRLYESSGSFSDHLPADFSWDTDDAHEIQNEVRDMLIDHHEVVAAVQANLIHA